MLYTLARGVLKERPKMRTAIYVATALVALTVALPAQATVTLKTPIERPDANHPSGHEFEISRKDCENAKDIFTFNLTLTDFADKELEVWLADESGLNCALSDDRSASQPSHCVQVTHVAPMDTLAVSIPSADIAAKLDGVTGCVDSSSNSSARPITLYFLLIDTSNGDVTDGNSATPFPTKIDLLGPSPPTELSAGLGSGLLVVSYTVPTSSDVDGFTVYCDPPPGGAAATGAGGTGSSTGVTAAGSGGGGGAGSCSSSLLVPGDVPASTLASCGSAAKSTAKANAKGLTNFTSYAVAISSEDVLGNVGPLSELVCGTPAPVDDFFDAYKEAGGTGGGCNVADGFLGDAPTTGALGLGLVGLVLLARRASSKGQPASRRSSR